MGVGGRPVKSNVARRSKVRRSAEGVTASLRVSSSASTNRSMALQGQEQSFTVGKSTTRTFWNDHHPRASSGVMPPIRGDAVRGSGDPRPTHSTKEAISASASFPPCSCGGICGPSSTYCTARIKRLSFGFPGVIGDPRSPPFCQPSRVSSARPPFVFPLAAE